MARDFTRRALEDWGWTAPEAADPARRPLDAEDVVLLVSELVTNAAVHGGGVRELLLRRLPDALRVEVADASAPAPRPRNSGPGEPGGYGLHIVAKLSSMWGHHGDGPGKRVWAQVDACWPAPGRLL